MAHLGSDKQQVEVSHDIQEEVETSIMFRFFWKDLEVIFIWPAIDAEFCFGDVDFIDSFTWSPSESNKTHTYQAPT